MARMVVLAVLLLAPMPLWAPAARPCFLMPLEQYSPTLTGIASYYLLEGRLQANGKKHRGARMTAAMHQRTLGDTVTVRRLDNGRTIQVVVTDRFGKDDPPDRLIDLSRAAAKKLGIIHQGICPVEVR